MNEQDIYMEQEQLTQEADRYAPVSTGTFFWHRVLYGIPVIGWILCLVFSFTQKNVNKRNFARATLISLIISLVITCIIGVAVVKVAEFVIEQLVVEMVGGAFGDFDQLTDVVDELQDGKYDPLIQRVENGEFGQHPELGSLLEEVKKGGVLAAVEQMQSGNFEDVMEKYADGAYDDLIQKAVDGELGDLGALGDLIEQMKNGDLSGIPGDLVP
jgi:hypothetical protein